MRLHADSRRRSIVLLTGGALLIFVLLGTLTWFNTSNVNFLNPATYEQTIALTALEVLLFLLLLLLLVLLFRTVLKVYVGQGSSGLGARLRSRMVLGAVIITFMPAALMFLFSYFLLNRSLERWFSPDASQLARRLHPSRAGARGICRQQCAQRSGVGGRKRSARRDSSGSPTGYDFAPPYLARRLPASSTAVTSSMFSSFQAPPESSRASLRASTPESEWREAPLLGPLSAAVLSAAQRNDNPVVDVAGQEYALGQGRHSIGQNRDRRAAHAQGTQCNHRAHPFRAPTSIGSSSDRAESFATRCPSLCCWSLSSSSFPASGSPSFSPSRSRTQSRPWPTPWMPSPPVNTSSAWPTSPLERWATWCVLSITWLRTLKPAANWPRLLRRNSPRPTSPLKSVAASWKRSSIPFPRASSRLMAPAWCYRPTAHLPRSWGFGWMRLWQEKASHHCCPRIVPKNWPR